MKDTVKNLNFKPLTDSDMKLTLAEYCQQEAYRLHEEALAAKAASSQPKPEEASASPALEFGGELLQIIENYAARRDAIMQKYFDRINEKLDKALKELHDSSPVEKDLF